MSDLTKNIALGAAAVGAGAVIAGATILTSSNSPLSLTSGSGGGGGVTVSVTVAEIDPSVSLTNPAENDVFLSSTISTTTTFKDTLYVGYTLTAPNGTTCELPTYADSTDAWATTGATHNGSVDLSTCAGGAKGVYKLKAYAPGLNVYSERQFSYSSFSLGSVVFDRNGDPILLVSYGQGIGIIGIAAYCGGSSADVLNGYDYVVENNADSVDEVLLPFKNKSVPAGDCIVEATAKKANGNPLNSQDITGATVRTTFTYTGL